METGQMLRFNGETDRQGTRRPRDREIFAGLVRRVNRVNTDGCIREARTGTIDPFRFPRIPFPLAALLRLERKSRFPVSRMRFHWETEASPLPGIEQLPTEKLRLAKEVRRWLSRGHEHGNQLFPRIFPRHVLGIDDVFRPPKVVPRYYPPGKLLEVCSRGMSRKLEWREPLEGESKRTRASACFCLQTFRHFGTVKRSS